MYNCFRFGNGFGSYGNGYGYGGGRNGFGYSGLGNGFSYGGGRLGLGYGGGGKDKPSQVLPKPPNNGLVIDPLICHLCDPRYTSNADTLNAQ
ncbi:hypothetical protein QE152_g23334 [Popillia japonica]|uniref:Uncharacterized protein n=1 Tax=Popillia japonica TaxID=7064 RepID=A0AAW1KIR8_POPJA